MNNLATRAVNLLGLGSLFGSIATQRLPSGATVDFIPTDDEGGTLDLRGTDHPPQWLGLESRTQQMWAYRYCPPLSSVIDRIAEADTNGRVSFLNNDLDNTPVKNPNKIPQLNRIKKLMLNPNPWQTAEEFNAEQLILCKIFGYCPVLAISPFGFDKSHSKYLINISPEICDPVTPNGIKILSIGDDFNPIKEWRINIFGEQVTIKSSDILLVKDGFISIDYNRGGLPLSKIAGLDFAISNICAAMEADNVLLRKKGPLGIFSADPKPDIAGWLPMAQEHKDELQKDLGQYGLTLGQLQYVISKNPLKWNPMSFNVRDLMTKETVRQGSDMIADRFGYPPELMSGKNATYENKQTAERFFYQTTVIPFSLRRMARYDKFFGLEDFILYQSYQHLPVLQEDAQKAALAYKDKSDGLLINWMAGIISYNQYLVGLEMETVAGGESLYYPQWLEQNKIMQNGGSEQKAPAKETK